MTTFEVGKNGTPGSPQSALKMHRLDAHQRQPTAPREQASRARACREVNVLFESAPQPNLLFGNEFGERHEIAVENILGFGTQHISQPAGHARTEIQAERPQDDGHAAGHVFTTVLADTLHYSKRTTVSDSETLPTAAGNEELAGRRAIEHRVAGKHVAAP